MRAKRLNEAPVTKVRCKTLNARTLRPALSLAVARERLDRYGRQVSSQLDDPALVREVLAELRAQNEHLLAAGRELQAQAKELERSSRARNRERQHYQDVFNFSAEALFVSDRAGRVREANHAATKLLGVGARSLRGRDLGTFLDESDALAFRDALKALERGAVIDLEVVFEAHSQPPPRAVLSGSRMQNRSSFLWRATVTGGVERLLSDPPPPSIEHVETVVAQRTRALEGALRDHERMLDRERKSREELETASNAKDRSIAILSHELRAPVHAILGWTKLLRQSDIGADARERGLTVIERNALAQAELVETLLDISRIASNKMTLAHGPVDFADVVSLAVDALRPEACRKRISLSSEIRRGRPILGDALRLQQIAMNLVGNAIRYTQPGGWVGVRVAHPEDGDATLVVSDSGRGVSAELMPRLFECFQQGEEHPGQGLGLGLYLVRKFVEMHGGTVRAESDGENRGATFTVRIPAHHHHEVAGRSFV